MNDVTLFFIVIVGYERYTECLATSTAHMKDYMALFLGSTDKVVEARADNNEESKTRMQEGMMAWGKWMEDHKASIVETGSPLGKTKKVNKEGVSDTRNDIGAYTVVRAESHEEAAKMFEGHPHFMIFPGDRVEVMECLPMPKP